MILKNKNVVITGGSSGIGRGIAIAAARHGARHVVIGDLTEKPKEFGPPTAALLSDSGTDASFLHTDVSQEMDVIALVEKAEAFGGVDLMVCNAGIAGATDTADVSPEEFARMVTVNLTGVLYSAQAAARAMTARGQGGSIVLISSIAGIRGNPCTVGYSATKGGVNMLAASLAGAHGPAGIRINAVCPGLINTQLAESNPALANTFEAMCERMPLRRLGRPEEIGDVVAWLGSDYSSFVTGVTLPVDGGQLAVV